MLSFFRKIRRRLFLNSKISRYILYAFGEIILVVVGILIAIQINDWNRENKLLKDEQETYQIIITDLKRDSTLFSQYNTQYNRYLDTYFQLNKIKNENGNFKGFLPDFLVSNTEFNPVFQKNNQPIIEKLRSTELRNQINKYFRRLNQVEQANNEFNKIIEAKSRQFFLQEHNILKNEAVFDYEDRTFPPFKGVSTVDTVKLRNTFDKKYFTPIISELRMSMGFYLIALERSIEENKVLIKTLQKRH